MLVNGWHANHIFGNWIITEMLFLEFASVGPMLGQADISTLAQRRTNGWITIGRNPAGYDAMAILDPFVVICTQEQDLKNQ